MSFDRYVPCHVITGRNPPQRCVGNANHRGPHWEKTEDLPEFCTCTGICHCPATVHYSAPKELP